MTAAELYEIVKDVPREAWPSGGDEWGTQQIVFNHGQWDMQTHIGQNISAVPAWLAELAFIGSMTAWLPLGWVVGKCEGHDCPDGTDATHMVYDVTDTECVREWVGSSLVAALAAACKEAA